MKQKKISTNNSLLKSVFHVATTTTTTTTTTTVFQPIVSAYWSFDNTTADLYNVYNGQLVSGATYSLAGSLTVPYIGYGRALSLTAASNQSFVISTPFFGLNYTSFTIEAWIYYTLLTGDRGIFG